MDDNPAGRLLALLEEGKRFDKKKTQTIEAWGQLFGEDTSDIPAVLPRVLAQLGKVMALPAEIRTRVEAEGYEAEVYLEHLPAIEQKLSKLSPYAGWSDFIDGITPAAMSNLKVCSDLLHRHDPDPSLTAEQIEDLRSQIQDLFEAIDDADITDELRQFLLRHLAAMDAALREARIVGLVQLRSEVLETIGELVVRPDIREQMTDTESGSQFWGIINHIITLTTLAKGVRELVENTKLTGAFIADAIKELPPG